jgi:hypothetical protein
VKRRARHAGRLGEENGDLRPCLRRAHDDVVDAPAELVLAGAPVRSEDGSRGHLAGDRLHPRHERKTPIERPALNVAPGDLVRPSTG